MVTVLDCALARGAKENPDGSISAGEITRVKLPFTGGCQGCGASIACYNAYPSRSGYLKCGGCIDDDTGFQTTVEFETWSKESKNG